MVAVIWELLIPVLMLTLSCAAMAGKQDAYSLLITGAQSGLQTVLHILPPLVILLASVTMLRHSGALDRAAELAAPLCAALGIPPETVPLMVIRPISGTAALAVGGELIAAYGVDSHIGRTAAVMLGSTETTFYTISVYFGAAKIRKTRYAIPAALLADLTGFVTAAWAVRWMFGT